jgi:hypothetical protein
MQLQEHSSKKSMLIDLYMSENLHACITRIYFSGLVLL